MILFLLVKLSNLNLPYLDTSPLFQKEQNISNEEFPKLRHAHEVLETHSLSITDFNKFSKDKSSSNTTETNWISHQTAYRRFRSWNNALLAAGIPLSKKRRRANYESLWSEEDLLYQIDKFVTEQIALKGKFTYAEYEKWSRVSEQRPSGSLIRVRIKLSWNQIMVLSHLRIREKRVSEPQENNEIPKLDFF